MAKLYTLVGLPASGKSTFTNKMNCVIVSTDDIREELYGDANIQGNGKEVFDIAFRRMAEALKVDCDVVFDATNVSVKARKRALRLNAYHVAVFFNVDKELCKIRNKKRGRVVPDEVIDRMADRLVAPTIKEGFNEIIEIK